MKLSISILFFILFLSIPRILFAEEQTTVVRDVSQKLLLLESKVSRLKETQEQLLAKNKEIQEELHVLGIWIRRHRG